MKFATIMFSLLTFASVTLPALCRGFDRLPLPENQDAVAVRGRRRRRRHRAPARRQHGQAPRADHLHRKPHRRRQHHRHPNGRNCAGRRLHHHHRRHDHARAGAGGLSEPALRSDQGFYHHRTDRNLRHPAGRGQGLCRQRFARTDRDDEEGANRCSTAAGASARPDISAAKSCRSARASASSMFRSAGVAKVTNDLLGGHISLRMVDMATGTPFVRDGQLKALAACGERSPSLPQVASYKDQGIDFERSLSWVMYAPQRFRRPSRENFPPR